MSTKDRAANRAQDFKGRVKEAIGSLTGNRALKSEGRADQGKAGLKNAGEDVKDAAQSIKDAVNE